MDGFGAVVVVSFLDDCIIAGLQMSLNYVTTTWELWKNVSSSVLCVNARYA